MNIKNILSIIALLGYSTVTITNANTNTQNPTKMLREKVENKDKNRQKTDFFIFLAPKHSAGYYYLQHSKNYCLAMNKALSSITECMHNQNNDLDAFRQCYNEAFVKHQINVTEKREKIKRQMNNTSYSFKETDPQKLANNIKIEQEKAENQMNHGFYYITKQVGNILLECINYPIATVKKTSFRRALWNEVRKQQKKPAISSEQNKKFNAELLNDCRDIIHYERRNHHTLNEVLENYNEYTSNKLAHINSLRDNNCPDLIEYEENKRTIIQQCMINVMLDAVE